VFTYIIRRLLYAVPILIGVNLLTTLLFFYVNTPDDMARMMLGEKNLTPAVVENWKKDHGYDQPLFINSKEKGIAKVTQTIFFQKSAPLLWLDFGSSDRNNVDIAKEIKGRMWASLAIAIPTFIIGIATYLTFSMLLAYARGTYLDMWGVTLCVVMMSVSALLASLSSARY